MAVQTVTADDVELKVLRLPGPAVLDFYQASCPPCRMLEPRLERAAEQYTGRLPVYRMDIDRDMAVAERFPVMSIPTLLILRNGQEVERLDGLITEADLEAAFDRATRAANQGA
jgi:thioredoxin